MNADLLRQFDDAVRRRCQSSGRQVEQLPRVTRLTGQTADQFDNLILWSQLDEQSAEPEIDSQMAYFRELGHSFEWFVFGHDQPKNLGELLLARGFEVESEETVVVAPSNSMAAQLPPDGIELVALKDPVQVKDVATVSNAVWGNRHEAFVARWLTDLIKNSPDESIIIVAYDGDKPVGAGWSTLRKDRAFAPLFGGTVLPEYRGRGIYRAMVAVRMQAAADRGIEWCFVEAGPNSFPILDQLGFETITTRTCYRWTIDP